MQSEKAKINIVNFHFKCLNICGIYISLCALALKPVAS